ncbi:hypothetical protein HDU86_005571 [Geranomyces michiganensis]|nr:hypothetical protein HDU86_005571 [Geranomyces michiganensis]
MKALAIVKPILQVVALTMILLTWSSIGRVFEGLTAKSNSLLLWFGPPIPPKQIHVGEIYNLTIDYVASLATRKTFLNATITLVMSCSSGNPADGSEYHFDNFLVNEKSGTRFVEFPMTEAELHPDAASSLCHLTLAYTYWPNMALKGMTTPIVPTSDEATSDVFKLVRAPRLRPLPLASAPVLDPADRRLSM